MWELDHKEGWTPKNWCFFWTVCWRRLLRVPWTARRSNQPILKKISPDYSWEGLMLKLKLPYFSHLMRRTDSLDRPWCWEGLRAGGEGDNRGWDGWMISATQWTFAQTQWSLSRLQEMVKDGEVWRAAVHGFAKSWTWLSNWTTLVLNLILGKLVTLRSSTHDRYVMAANLPFLRPFPPD